MAEKACAWVQAIYAHDVKIRIKYMAEKACAWVQAIYAHSFAKDIQIK